METFVLNRAVITSTLSSTKSRISCGKGGGQGEILGVHDDARLGQQQEAIGARLVNREARILGVKAHGHLVAGALEDGGGDAACRPLHCAVNVA